MKLQQKQLKIQQKKNDKEQKHSGTLKSNKNNNKLSNETSSSIDHQPAVSTSSVSTTIPIDDEKRFSEGVRFKGKLVGIEPVMASRGDKMCQNALKNLRLLRRSTSSHKQRIIININLNGVQLLDQKTNDLVANHVINLISYITRDITDNKIFGYVYGTPEVGHQFIAIKSEKDSMFVMNAIGELFTYVYNKKKKEREKQEQENQNQFDRSTADNSQSSHTLVDDKQPQSKGYDNDTLMQFLQQQQEKLHSGQASNSQTLPTISAIGQEANYEKEHRYLQQENNHSQQTLTTNANANKYHTLPPPLPSRNMENNYSDSLDRYSSYSNYDQNYLDASGHTNYQSNISIATTTQDGSYSEMQQMQNVISSARNDKYAVFNDINSMKLSIFEGDELIKSEDDQVFITNTESKQPKANLSSLNSSQNQTNEFEDSFLNKNSLNRSKDSNTNKSYTTIQQQLNHSMNQSKENSQINSTASSLYSSFNDPDLMVECHKKFLQERQEKLDQIDSIFETEKIKLRTRQRELNNEHLKQQKNLLNQQKSYQQEFYQRQKHQRQAILHQLQLQRLPVAQFDQCKMQLQNKLKDDQKQLQQEFIQKQQELKKKQTDEQNQLIKQYKLLEEQYLEKQSELLNSDFEIEIDLPELPNIFDNDDSMRKEQAMSRKFELSLKNEFDKLTNDIIQTTSSSLNSSPKMSERCSTACSITSSSSHNPFMAGEKSSKQQFDKNLFEDFDKALNLIDNKIDWSNRGSCNSSTSGKSNYKFDLDFYSFSGAGSNDSKENSLEYYGKDTNNERISSACSLDTNKSSSTLPISFQPNISSFINLNKSLNNESLQGYRMNTGSETQRPTLNLNSSLRSQHLSNSLPKVIDNTLSQGMIAGHLVDQLSNQQRSLNQQSLPEQFFENQFNSQTHFNQQRNEKTDPFNCSFVDTKLNEMNRIKEIRQHTREQLSMTLPETSTTSAFDALNQSVSDQLSISHTPSLNSENQKITNQTVKDDKKSTTSIQELEELLGLSTSRSSKNSINEVQAQNQTKSMNTSLNSSFNQQSSWFDQSKPVSKTGSLFTNNNSLSVKNSKMLNNLFDLKKNNSLMNFSNQSFSQSSGQQQQSTNKTNSSINLFADDNFTKNSLSFQDLRSDVRTEQFINNLHKNPQTLLPSLQQKNSLDVFGTVVVGDLNNQKTAKQLLNYFGSDSISSHERNKERNIFNSKEDPFKDDFFNS